MAEESDLERTFPATPRRLQQAREEGRVARSRELTAAVMALAAVLGLWGLGPEFLRVCERVVHEGLAFDRAQALDQARMGETLIALSTQLVFGLAPLLAVMFVAALGAPMLLSGWNITLKGVAPDFGRMNPVRGFGNMFSLMSLAELGKALLKTTLIAVVGYFAIRHMWPEMQGLMNRDVRSGIGTLGRLGLAGLAMLVGVLVVIAAIDVPYRLWRHYRSLRMTREELRHELREQEGDPQLKARVRSMQREMARKRMMAAVPRASVIVTNPTHYAVALEYMEGMRAPRVIAKGTELIAQKIREIGQTHKVPLLEAPPLARALYRHADIGDEIPQALYGVVAEVLAYVYQVQNARKAGVEVPATPTEFAVPPELDPLHAAARPAPDRAQGSATA